MKYLLSPPMLGRIYLNMLIWLMLMSNHSFSIEDLSRSSIRRKVWGIITIMWRSSWWIQRLSCQKCLFLPVNGYTSRSAGPCIGVLGSNCKAIVVNTALTRATFIPAPLKADTEHWWCSSPNLETFFSLAPKLGVMEILPTWLFRVWGCEVQHENPPGNRVLCATTPGHAREPSQNRFCSC